MTDHGTMTGILPVTVVLNSSLRITAYNVAGTIPTGGYPAEADVRDGVTYGASGEYEGEYEGAASRRFLNVAGEPVPIG